MHSLAATRQTDGLTDWRTDEWAGGIQATVEFETKHRQAKGYNIQTDKEITAQQQSHSADHLLSSKQSHQHHHQTTRVGRPCNHG